MDARELVCFWIAELLPMLTALGSFIYGIKNFFKKGVPLYLQSVAMAMGCRAISGLYRLCFYLTTNYYYEGFTPAYLGGIGYFLFFLVASYGQMDKIVDDASSSLKFSRIIALLGPLAAVALFVYIALDEALSPSSKVLCALVWLPALFSIYFNLKHAIIPDLDFGFVKAIKPFNIMAVCLGFTELLCLSARVYSATVPMVVLAVVFSVLTVCTIITAKKGAEKWTI